MLLLLLLLLAYARAWTHELLVRVPLALLNVATEEVVLPMATIRYDERGACFDVRVRVDRNVAESAIRTVLHTLMQHDAEECASVRSSEALAFDARASTMLRAAVDANPGDVFLKGYEMHWGVCPTTLVYDFVGATGSILLNERLFCHVKHNINAFAPT